jgi:N-terminal domain of anti-restriction factor ArdC/IrrE N-terminal-like domain
MSKKHVCTDEDQEHTREKHAQTLEALKRGVESLGESGVWMRYLKMQSRFHAYSFHNTLLILLQFPSATRVAGYKTWLSLGRQVRKGERGIAILVPHIRRGRAEVGEVDDETIDSNALLNDSANGYANTAPRISFGLGYVFDISQTDGKPLPEVCLSLSGDDHALCRRLDEIIVRRGIAVSEVIREQIAGANGTCHYDKNGMPKAIYIADDLPPLHKAKTRVHELAHALMHGDEEYRLHNPQSLIETEAESVSYVVLQHFGFDSADFSFGYLLVFNGGNVEEVARALKASGTRIQATAEGIIDEIENLESGGTSLQDGAAVFSSWPNPDTASA